MQNEILSLNKINIKNVLFLLTLGKDFLLIFNNKYYIYKSLLT